MSNLKGNDFDHNDPESADVESGHAIAMEADRIISSLLHDLLGEHDCPNFQSQIQSRIENLNESSHGNIASHSYESLSAVSLFTEAEHLAATNLAFTEHQENGVPSEEYVIPPAVAAVTYRQEDIEPDLSVWIRRASFLVAALAAAVVGVLLYPVLTPSRVANETQQGSGLKPTQAATGTLPVLETRPQNESSENSASSSRLANQDSSKETYATKTTNGQLAESMRDKVANNPAPTSDSVALNEKLAPSSVLQGALPDKEMVAIIDGQLQHLWERVGVQPTSEIKTEAWLDRSTQAIVGRLPTAAEKEAFRSNKSGNKKLDFVDRLIASDEFSRKWSLVLANHYLGRSDTTSNRKQPKESENEFVSWLSQALSKQTFAGELEREMIAGPRDGIANKVDSELESGLLRTDPASYLLSEWLTQTDSETEDLQASTGNVSKEQSQAAFVSASRQWMRITGSSTLVCSQCHEGDSHSKGFESFLASTVSNRGTESFWNVSANLTPFSMERNKDRNVLKVGKAKDVFVEDAEGRMKVMKPMAARSNSGTESARVLGDWLLTSEEARKSLVNSVWDEIFGQPLVPVLGLTDQEGLHERVQLRDLLAKQMQQRQTDLGTVVRWLVMSTAFGVESPKVDTPWYLKATDSQVADVQHQLKLFAASSAMKLPSSETTQNASASPSLIAGWIDSNRMDDSNNLTLAQPSASITATKQESSKLSKLIYSDSQIRFLMESKRPYDQVALFADRIGKSSMTFPKMVDHAFLATSARFPSSDERELALKVFEVSNRDAVRALMILLNAQLFNK